MITKQPWETDAFHQEKVAEVERRTEYREQTLEAVTEIREVLATEGAESAFVKCVSIAYREALEEAS